MLTVVGMGPSGLHLMTPAARMRSPARMRWWAASGIYSSSLI
jgi:hypothetical protein